MVSLMAFPLIDYALRFGALHRIGVVWDKLVLALLIVIAIVRYLAGHRPPRWIWHKFAWWYMAYCVALVFAGLDKGVLAFAELKMDIYYIFYALVVPFAIEEEDVPLLMHTALTVGILAGVDGLFQYLTKAPIPSNWVDVHEHVRTRVYSILQSPNEFGSYMAMTVPVAVGMGMYERNRWRKMLYLGGAAVCLLALLFTFTRGAFVALVVAALLAAFLFERRIFIPMAGLLILVAFLPAVQHRFADLFSPVYWIKAAQGGRILRWKMAFDKMTLDPLFGVGLGRFGGAVATRQLGTLYADNYYVKVLAESGLVGLILFLSLQLALLRQVLQSVRKSLGSRVRFALLGIATGLLVVLIHNLFENVFEFAPMIFTYFLYANLALVWPTEAGSTDHKFRTTTGLSGG